MGITLRDYQDESVVGTRKAFAKGEKHVLIQIPTGGGKTIVFCYIAQQMVLKGKKALIITDRNELLNQASDKLKEFDLYPGYVKAGTKVIDYSKNVYVASSQTLRNRIGKKEWNEFISKEIDLVIIDECHGQEFNHLFLAGLLDNRYVIGVTATPERKGKMRQLGIDYERIIYGPSVKELIKRGFLVNCDHYEVESADMTGVGIDAKNGDYMASQMFKKFDKPTLYKGLIKQYKEYAPNEKMIVFCCNVEHAINTCIELHRGGYAVKFLASKKSPPKEPADPNDQGQIERYKERLRVYNIYKENFNKFSGSREQTIEDYKNNKFTILVNVDMLTKGFDCPDITVVALYRATTSLALYLQMIGRGSRISPETGKTHFTVLDFGENKKRLGRYDDNREWSRWHNEQKNGSGVVPMKECGIDSKGKRLVGAGDVKKGCTRLIPVMMNICPFCGFKTPNKKVVKEVELTLASVKDENGVSLAVKPVKQMDFSELKKYREIKKHHQAWIWRQLWMKGRENKLKEYAAWDGWSPRTLQQALNFCKNKLG